MKKILASCVAIALILSTINSSINITQKTAYAKSRINNIGDADSNDDNEYIENVDNFKYDDLEISDEEAELMIGEQMEISIMTVEDAIPVRASWHSSNPSIASITQNGLITAKKVGTSIITGVVSNYTYECFIVVEKNLPTYKTVVKKAKKYNSKYVKFKHIDVGYESRLLGEFCYGSKEYYNSHGTMTRGFIVELQPYINIKKNEDTADISLNFTGKYRCFSVNSYYRNFTKIKLYTNNRRITYDITSISKKHKKYQSITQWKSEFSSNNSQSIEKLNKLIKIFEHKKVTIKTSTANGKHWCLQKPAESTRKHWLKLFKTYKKLLKMYE